MKYLTIMPGLLISMSIRYDHAFMMPNDPILNNSAETLETRQIKSIRKMKLFYDFVARDDLVGATKLTDEVTAGQLIEEMEGKGYYHYDKEVPYQRNATDAALAEARQIAGDYVSKSGPKPVLTLVPQTLEPGVLLLDDTMRIDDTKGEAE